MKITMVDGTICVDIYSSDDRKFATDEDVLRATGVDVADGQYHKICLRTVAEPLPVAGPLVLGCVVDALEE